jgi:hypothetical protein
MNSKLPFAPQRGWRRKRRGRRAPRPYGSGQKRRARSDGWRPDGTATTTTQSASIASPMNSNTNASTAMSPKINPLKLWGPH